MCVREWEGRGVLGYPHNTDWQLTLRAVVAEGLHCARAGCGFTHGWRVRKRHLCPAAICQRAGRKLGVVCDRHEGVEGQFSLLHSQR